MDEQLQRANELFLVYRGSFFQMNRAGVFEEYKSYSVTKEAEQLWYNELIAALTRELSIMNWDAVSSLESIAKYYPDRTIVENVIHFMSHQISGSDSIVRLIYAETLIKLIKSTEQVLPHEVLVKAYRAAVHTLEDVISKPLVIDPGHELPLFQLKDKRSLNNRAKKSIDELNDYLN